MAGSAWQEVHGSLPQLAQSSHSRSRMTPKLSGPTPPSPDSGAFRKPCAPAHAPSQHANTKLARLPIPKLETTGLVSPASEKQRNATKKLAVLTDLALTSWTGKQAQRAAGPHPDQRRLVLQALQTAVANLQQRHLLREQLSPFECTC